MRTVDFLDAIKTRYNLPSDYAIQKVLGIHRSTISTYRTKDHAFDDEIAVKVAHVLDLPEGYVLACCHRERSKSPTVKKAWGAIAVKLMSLTLLISSGFSIPTPGVASVSDLTSLYIMRNCIIINSYIIVFFRHLFCFSLKQLHFQQLSSYSTS